MFDILEIINYPKLKNRLKMPKILEKNIFQNALANINSQSNQSNQLKKSQDITQ